MASPRSSATSYTSIMSPSVSPCSQAVERSARSCNLSLIPSRALKSGHQDSHLRRMKIAHSYRHFCRLNSLASLAGFPSTLSRSNRARTDSIFLLTGDFCKRCYSTSPVTNQPSYLMQFQECIEGRLDTTGHRISLRVEDKRQKLTVKWATWLYIDCCCDICSGR